MKPFLRLASVLMIAASASLVAACDNKASEQAETAAAPAEGAPTAAAGPFDVSSVALSSANLGDFPYLRLPEGYRLQNNETHDFADFPFWTGSRFEMVEGRVHQTQIDNDSGKSFSRLELLRNMEHALKEAGAVRIFDGQIPNEAAHALPEAVQMAALNGIGDIYNSPSQTWIIRQANRTVWVHLYVGSESGSLAVAEVKALVPTAGLLPASELAKKIAADGRVAVPVEFALDKADILDASRPQIDAVTQLLKDDAALRLSVEGHTDNTGAPARNRPLSEERARAVVAALTQQGIDAKRLEAKGFGSDKPVADNASDEGRARNRRVELVRLS
ncbi:OmpA family protein [Brevundimonas diminuta]|uniref:OmpA family protein n=1 Tax=Brevundimonas diminuta TaxID=293 RepID=UPI003CFC1A26